MEARNYAIVLKDAVTQSRQGASSFWRYHLQGARKIIVRRGGMRLFAESTGAIPLLLLFTRYDIMK